MRKMWKSALVFFSLNLDLLMAKKLKHILPNINDEKQFFSLIVIKPKDYFLN